ncbi:MAG: zinc ribbon domain-containing protein, partial [Anaerolineae bacterium]|nr:zinc ribbon domain-containing protein [Anaerolineae bacterium]
MPLYDYRCANGHAFEARHSMNSPAPACPVCGAAQVQRVITAAPRRL